MFFLSFQMKESIMNQEKLAKLQAQVRIGGKVSDQVNALSHEMLLFSAAHPALCRFFMRLPARSVDAGVFVHVSAG